MVAHSQSTGTVIVGQRALFREGVAALAAEFIEKHALDVANLDV